MKYFVIVFLFAAGCASTAPKIKNCRDKSLSAQEKCQTIEVETLNDCRYKAHGSEEHCQIIDVENY